MSMVTYPLNNIEYTAEDAELFHSTRTSGVYATDSFDYSVTGADNSIVIGTGIAWIKNRQFSGKVVAQKEPMSLDMGLPDPTYPRIDAVVIQFNSNKNATEIVVKNGSASSFPIAPEVVRTESLYELHLYHVRREAGSLSISAPNITDLRNNNAYCGLMSDSITQAVDSTLSKNGVAADAAAVGNALANKAPAGYGLGETPKKVSASAIDTLTAPGWYALSGSVTAGKLTFYNGYVHVSALDANTATQTLYAIKSGTYILTRSSSYPNGFKEWDFLTYPMELGVEYRTTERWQGRAVYTKLVDCGAMPNATRKYVSYSNENIKPVRCVGIGKTGNSTYPEAYNNDAVYIYADGNNIAIYSNWDVSGGEAYAQVWYVKN